MIPHRFARLLGAVVLLAPSLAFGQSALQQPLTSGKADTLPVALSKLYANDIFLQSLVANRFAALGPAAFLNIGTVTGSLADGGVLTAEIARAKGVEQANALAIQANASTIAAETSRAQAAEATKAPIASPAFTGAPTVPTAVAGTATTQIANTGFVGAAVSGKANQADLAALASATLDAVNGKLDLAGGTMTGGLALPSISATGAPALDLTFANTINPNAVMFRPGNSVSFCPLLSCIQGPTGGAPNSTYWDHQRATLLISGQTQDDAHSEEQTLAITTTVGTKRIKPYAASTAYAVGDNIAIGNAVYRATVAGTTGTNSTPPGSRPASLPFTTADGSVTWTWINDAAISGAQGMYNEVTAIPGAGSVWGGVDNLQLQSGVIPSFNVGREIDLTNNSGTDCAIGVANCNGLYVALNGSNKSTSGVAISSANTANFAGLWGIQVAGNKLASEADIDIEGGAKVGLGFNTSAIGAGSHSIAAIQDASTGPRSLYITGAHTTASIDDPSTSPTGHSITGTKSVAEIILGSSSPKAIRIQGTKTSASIEDVSTSPATVVSAGTKSLAGVYEASTTPNGISLAGTYSGSQINGAGWSVDPTGKLTTPGTKLTGFTVAALPTCNAAAKGFMTMATDVSAAPTYRQTGLTGGGSIAVPVFCNGSAYEAH